MTLPTSAEERKRRPIYSGVLSYFPETIKRISRLELGKDDPITFGSAIIDRAAPDVVAFLAIDELQIRLKGPVTISLSAEYWLRTHADALAEIAYCSWLGNEQHNPGEPLHWAREKSADHMDCMLRHYLEGGEADSDGVSHAAKAAWRACAHCELWLEAEE